MAASGWSRPISRIVRLGEGLSTSGRLSDEAMERALAALKVSGEKVRRRRVVKFRAIATQACRIADNGQAFVNRVANETGVKLQIITPAGRGPPVGHRLPQPAGQPPRGGRW